MLPSDPKARKRIPLATGLLDYFPDALADVAGLSLVANEQHNPGEPLHWSRHKSNDHDDCLMRHFMERGTVDSDGIRHRAKVAWRALAALQLEIEAAREREEAAERRRQAAEPFRDPNFWDWSAHPEGPPRPQAYDAHPFDPVAAEEAGPEVTLEQAALHVARRTVVNTHRVGPFAQRLLAGELIEIAEPVNYEIKQVVTGSFGETLKGVIPGSARLDGQPLNLPSDADGS